MKTINANSTGNEFIKDLNDNFAECMAGASDGSITVKALLQGGELKVTDGRVDGRWSSNTTQPSVGTNLHLYWVDSYTDDNFTKYLHTPLYLSLIGNKFKSEPTIPSGSTLSIFCYDDTFTLISDGVVNSAANIPDGTSYVKLQVYNANGFAQTFPLSLTLSATPKFVKNSDTPLVPRFINFECKPPKLFDDAACATPHVSPTGATADVDNIRYHDNCFVMLPPNYSPEGEPTKFIIFFTGDGAAWFMAHNPFLGVDSSWNVVSTPSIYKQNFEYLCNMGYAVVSMCGYTSMWGNEYGSLRPSWFNGKIKPSYIASLQGCYDYLMSNYNFDYRPYIAAKSAGGYMMLHTAATMPFPVRAAAGFSIGINLVEKMRHQLLSAQKSWQKMMGHPSWDSFALNNNEGTPSKTANPNSNDATEKADGDLLVAQKDRYRTLDPMLIMANVSDYSAYFNAVMTGANTQDAMRDAMHKVVSVPIKLWCATEDTAVSYEQHEQFVDMVNRGGGIAELRSYTGSDGTHHTFCGGKSGGGKVANNLPTPYGDTMSGVNIGVVEAVEWFKRW